MNKYIYTVTTVSSNNSISSRMWGAFTTKDKAIWAAKNNKDFFSEGRYYEYVVVEKYALNCLLQTSEEIMWYDLTLEKVIEKPECFDRIVDFAFC